jgi:FkbM family methyltransferase
LSGAADIYAAQARILAGQAVPVVIDAGAFVGDTPLKYHQLFPDAVIHALEPDPENFRQLEQFTAAVPNIRRHPLAAGDFDGTTVLHRNGYAPTHSLLPRPSAGKRYFPETAGAVGFVEVPVTRLDTFCRQQAIDFVGVLKLDVQGGEVAALTGATELLSAGRIGVLCTEVAFVPHYRDAPLMLDVWQLLAKFGYTPYDLHAQLYGTDGQLRYADALFVSPAFRRDLIDPMTVEP